MMKETDMDEIGRIKKLMEQLVFELKGAGLLKLLYCWDDTTHSDLDHVYEERQKEWERQRDRSYKACQALELLKEPASENDPQQLKELRAMMMKETDMDNDNNNTTTTGDRTRIVDKEVDVSCYGSMNIPRELARLEIEGRILSVTMGSELYYDLHDRPAWFALEAVTGGGIEVIHRRGMDRNHIIVRSAVTLGDTE